MPGAMFSNQKPCYLLRCSTFTQTINLSFYAFHDEKLRRSLYDLNIQGASIENININNASDVMRLLLTPVGILPLIMSSIVLML